MGNHLINGEFQSDKYPTTPRGKVPLSCKDVTAQDLLWEYAQRRRAVDAEFSEDLEAALRLQGFSPLSEVSLNQAIERAAAEPTLKEAFAWIAVWETDRAVRQAVESYRTGVRTTDGMYDTSFRFCFDRLMEAWDKKHDAVAIIVDALTGLTDEERVEVIARVTTYHFCEGCGRSQKDGVCQCRNDD